MTRSSGPAGRRVVPFLPSRILSLLPTRGSLPPGVTGRVAVAHGRQGQGSGRFGGVDKKAAGTSSWLGAAVKRRPWRIRGTSTLAWRLGQRQASFFLLFFHGVYFFALFPVALGGLTANAFLDCLCFAEVYVDREVRRLISFLYLYLVFC